MLPSPFRWQAEHLRIDLPGAHVLFTTRRGGVSSGPYESLNLGRWTPDDPAAVAENRERVQALAGARFAFGRQVHGTEVASVGVPTGAPAEHDGVLTAVAGVAPMVLVADCLPIALAGGGAVGMLHGGWRGLAGGIVPQGVSALRALAPPDASVAAAIGPGAGPCCYTVSDEVRVRFPAEARRGRNLDLKAAARAQLEAAGVAEIHDCGLCTICAPAELLFSHRRDEGTTGRQAGVAWRR